MFVNRCYFSLQNCCTRLMHLMPLGYRLSYQQKGDGHERHLRNTALLDFFQGIFMPLRPFSSPKARIKLQHRSQYPTSRLYQSRQVRTKAILLKLVFHNIKLAIAFFRLRFAFKHSSNSKHINFADLLYPIAAWIMVRLALLAYCFLVSETAKVEITFQQA
jgi:hypothetical protein